MQIIKPGKLARTKDSTKDNKKSIDSSKFEVWEDFSTKKKSKKQEYEKGAGNRMFPKQEAAEEEVVEEKPELEEEKYQPRTDYQVIEERLGVELSERELLSRALTHRSALGARERADYERLEFLGDAVLDLSVAHLLSDRHPEAKEGELSKMRAALVNTQALAIIATKLDLSPFIKLGRGEHSSGGHKRPSILADVTEAIIGAVYRDKGYQVAFDMIERLFDEDLDKVTPYDPKTELQEALHSAGSEPPQYLLEMVEGPEHAPNFVTVVVVDAEIAGRGKGTTKKAAQQIAASIALSRMFPSAEKVTLVEGQSFFIQGAMLTIEQSERPYVAELKESLENANATIAQ